MRTDFDFYLSVLLGFGVLVLFVLLVTNLDFSQHKFSVVKNGVEFVSDSNEPSAIISDLRDFDEFVVSPVFLESGIGNGYMTSSLALLNSVLVAKGKKVVVVARVVSDDNGSLVECYSNFGDPKLNKKISLVECDSLLSSSGKALIFIEKPKSSVEGSSVSRVFLEDGKAIIVPSSFEVLNHASFVFIESLYSDASSIVASVNSVLGSL